MAGSTKKFWWVDLDLDKLCPTLTPTAAKFAVELREPGVASISTFMSVRSIRDPTGCRAKSAPPAEAFRKRRSAMLPSRQHRRLRRGRSRCFPCEYLSVGSRSLPWRAERRFTYSFAMSVFLSLKTWILLQSHWNYYILERLTECVFGMFVYVKQFQSAQSIDSWQPHPPTATTLLLLRLSSEFLVWFVLTVVYISRAVSYSTNSPKNLDRLQKTNDWFLV